MAMIGSFLDSIPDLAFAKDDIGVYLGCNTAFADFVGKARSQIIGRTDYDFFDHALADRFREHDRHVLEKQTACRNEECVTHSDGHRCLVETLKTPYRGSDGAVIGVLGISRDITSRKDAEQRLAESVANFRTFFESMTDLILVATPEGRIIFANRAVTRVLGYSAEAIGTLHLLDLHPPDKRREAEAIFSAMLRGEQESCPLPLLSRGGALIPVQTRVWLARWDARDCIFGICKDLREVHDAEQRFERLFRDNPCPMAVSNLPDRRLMDVNEAFLRLLGYTKAEVIGKTPRELRLFADDNRQEAFTARLLANGRAVDVYQQVRGKDGTLREGLFSGEVLESQGSRFLLSVMIDITAKRRIEADLLRMTEFQRSLLHLATDFVNVPADRQNEAINQSLATMGRLTRADRVYLFAYDFNQGTMSNTHEWCNDGITAGIDDLQDIPNAWFPEWIEAHQRGTLVHIPDVGALPPESRLREILAPQGIQSLITLPLLLNGVCLGYVGFDAVREVRTWGDDEIALLRVLAELYANFQDRRATERAIRALNEQLTDARDQAQLAAQAKTLFLANMSHEIRTPLNAVLGYAQVIGRECRACPMTQRVAGLTKSGEHLLELIDDLLDLARSDGQAITLRPDDFDFHQMLDDVLKMVAHRPEAKALKLEVRFAPDVPRVLHGDRGKVHQVLLNLVGNAVKFTERGSVILSAFVLDHGAAGTLLVGVDIADTGRGILPEKYPYIFDLFTRTKCDGRPKEGTGLGLPLSLRYAHALGGDVTADASRVGGCTFRFSFRVRPGGDILQACDTMPLLAPDQPRYRILTVDDDLSNREMMAAMLQSAGFEVSVSADAASALSLLRDSDQPAFDMVLMDKRMPGMDGYEAIQRIRELRCGGAIKVLLVSAAGFAEQRQEAITAGADGFVPKPVRLPQLIGEIARVAGIRFDHMPAPPAAPCASAAVSGLAAEQRSLLMQALRIGDIRSLRALVVQIAASNSEAAAAIRACVETYDYSGLQDLLTTEEPETT